MFGSMKVLGKENIKEKREAKDKLRNSCLVVHRKTGREKKKKEKKREDLK